MTNGETEPSIVTEYLYGTPFDVRYVFTFTFAPFGQEMLPVHLWMTFANSVANMLLFGALLYFALSLVRRAPVGTPEECKPDTRRPE